MKPGSLIFVFGFPGVIVREANAAKWFVEYTDFAGTVRKNVLKSQVHAR